MSNGMKAYFVKKSDGKNEVKAYYVKRLVSKRELFYYKNHPSYTILDEGEGGAEVAHTWVDRGQPRPAYLLPATEKDVAEINKRRGL